MQAELENYKQFQKKIEDIATRWVKAMSKNSGYTSAGRVMMSHDYKTINFTVNPCSSGIGWPMYISAKYLDDDSTLEKDAFEFYENKKKQRQNEYNRITELESTPEVKEYLKLKNVNGNDYFSCGNFLSLYAS